MLCLRRLPSFKLNLIRSISTSRNLHSDTGDLSTNEHHHSHPAQPQMKVTIIGGGGRTGKPLALMLKQCTLIDELALIDTSSARGFGIELAHIDTKCKIYSYTSADGLSESLEGAKVVVLLAAASGSSNKSSDDMFKLNSHMVKGFASEFSKYCPSALFVIATEPINSTVPIVSEVMKSNGTYNPNKIFGVTTLNVMRANTFVGNLLGLEPECITVPVIGGGADRTIVPVWSKAKPSTDFTLPEMQLLTSNVQMAHRDIANVKRSEGSTLAAGFAISRFVISLIKGLLGKPDVIECAFVKSIVHPNAKYLATPLQLGPGGVQRNLGIPELTQYEQTLLDVALTDIQKDVHKAEKFIGLKERFDASSSQNRDSSCRDECKQRSLYD